MLVAARGRQCANRQTKDHAQFTKNECEKQENFWKGDKLDHHTRTTKHSTLMITDDTQLGCSGSAGRLIHAFVDRDTGFN